MPKPNPNPDPSPNPHPHPNPNPHPLTTKNPQQANIAVFRVLLHKMTRAAATVFPMVIVLMVFLFIFSVLSMHT